MTIETEDVVARLELGAKQLYKDYEETTAEHVELIFSSEDAECKSLADEMREWFRAAVEAAGFVTELQSLSERIAVLEARIAVAKALIGCGQGDHPNAAIRESSINQAWHALDASLIKEGK